VGEFRQTSGRTLRDFLEERLGHDEVARTLSPERLMALGAPDHE